MANKDGLEPNKPIDFETLQRVKREQREAKKAAKEAPKPKATETKKKVPTSKAKGVDDAPADY